MKKLTVNRVLSQVLMASVLSVCALSAHADTTKEKFDKLARTKTISKDKLTDTLIGTWQCHFDDKDDLMGIRYQSTLTFDKNGTLTSKKTSHTKNPEGTYQVDVTRSWQLSQIDGIWLLQEKIINVDHFSVDKPELEKVFDVQQMLDDKSPQESLMIFEKKDGKDTLTRLDAVWGVNVGECVKENQAIKPND